MRHLTLHIIRCMGVSKMRIFLIAGYSNKMIDKIKIYTLGERTIKNQIIFFVTWDWNLLCFLFWFWFLVFFFTLYFHCWWSWGWKDLSQHSSGSEISWCFQATWEVSLIWIGSLFFFIFSLSALSLTLWSLHLQSYILWKEVIFL